MRIQRNCMQLRLTGNAQLSLYDNFFSRLLILFSKWCHENLEIAFSNFVCGFSDRITITDFFHDRTRSKNDSFHLKNSRWFSIFWGGGGGEGGRILTRQQKILSAFSNFELFTRIGPIFASGSDIVFKIKELRMTGLKKNRKGKRIFSRGHYYGKKILTSTTVLLHPIAKTFKKNLHSFPNHSARISSFKSSEMADLFLDTWPWFFWNYFK